MLSQHLDRKMRRRFFLPKASSVQDGVPVDAMVFVGVSRNQLILASLDWPPADHPPNAPIRCAAPHACRVREGGETDACMA